MTRSRPVERLTCADWRELPVERVAPLYAAEIERWTATLEWETTASWEEVERGRLLRTVSGTVVTDEQGTVVAWSYSLVHNGVLQVGGFMASTEAAVQVLLDAILKYDTLSAVQGVTFFAFADAPGLAPALRARGLAVDRYWYLGRDARQGVLGRLQDARRWRVEDTRAAADLLSRAYEAQDEARPFAPRGTHKEWEDYVGQLSGATGCGALLPEACLCIPGGPNQLAGLALVTRIAPGTAHLAQLVMDPQAQGRGVGGRLLELAAVGATQAGCRRLTLLVSGRNGRARRLYEGARFESMASFVSAGTFQPRRSTSVAPGGMVMTRR